MGYKWKPSKAAAQEFGEKMREIETFCAENGIQRSLRGDSYYFDLNGQSYRVSNHTVEQSNRKAFNENDEQIRALYHPEGRLANVIYITASKARIIDIYSDLKNGFQLDKRGRRTGVSKDGTACVKAGAACGD